MSVTIKDVAKHCKVSSATVSRVLNNDPRISEKTRIKVMKSVKELNYRINGVARSLKTNRTNTVGFICPEISNIFFMSIAKGVEDELKKSGYSVIICNSNENKEDEKERIKLLCEKCVDGIIIIPSTNEGKHFKCLNDANIPTVLVDRLVEDFQSDAVLVDNINGSYSAVEYLINKGFKRIGFIGGNIMLTSARERYEGYLRALKDYCIPLDESIVKFGDFHVESGYAIMKDLMQQDNPPHFVFISNYYMHAGATKYLIENKYNLKSNVLVASFDDMELSSIFGFSILRVRQPMTEIGIKAAQLLLNRIDGNNANYPQIIRLKTELITER